MPSKFFFVCLLAFVASQNMNRRASIKNNVCNSYEDYYNINFSENCSYNPDLFASVTEILNRYVGKYEQYKVITEDGYILSIFRIPPKRKPKGVVLLQHPLNADASVWLAHGRDNSLALNFSKSGYDVWLPSSRGNPYSSGHVHFTTDDPKYWDFSFHEIGIYDYSAIINFIKKKIGSAKIIFIGYSMSATASIAYASLMPEEAERNVAIFFEMTPAVYMKDIPFGFMSHICPKLSEILDKAGIVSIFTQQPFIRILQLFLVNLPDKRLLVEILSLASGWTPDEFDVKYINVALSLAFKPFSTKLAKHYCQIVEKGGNFTMFDYGRDKNVAIHGSVDTPEYPVQNISVPVYLMSSYDDYSAGSHDADTLFNKLSPKAKVYGQRKFNGINHVDFLFGKSRIEKVFNTIWSVINRMNVGT